MFIQRSRKKVVCKDGFSISIQASENHYCIPKVDGAYIEYKNVELGYPSDDESLIEEYSEGMEDTSLTQSVYPYVPAEIVKKMLDKHGGMVEGEMPKLNLSLYGGTKHDMEK